MKVLVLVLGFLVIVDCAQKNYNGYKIFKVVPNSTEQLKALDILKNQYEFWTEKVTINSDVKIMVSPIKIEEFFDYLKKCSINGEVVIENVQSVIDAQLIPANDDKSLERFRNAGSFTWDRYYNLEDIYAWLDELAALFPDVVRTVSMGNSVEGREIKGIIIDYHPLNTGSDKVIGMIEGGIHAREWISPAQVTWIINEFLTNDDADIRSMAENVEWHIFPVTNPDGYAYTFESDRMWRKNRNTEYFMSCAQYGLDDDLSNGVDLNRNFDFLWMEVGSSDIPCAQTFAGSTGFSEPEARAIANYVLSLQQQGNLMYFIAFHSYSQMLMIPFSHVDGADVLQNPNYGDLYEIAIRAADVLKMRHGTEYVVGTSANILYGVTGSSDDWVKGVAEVPLVFLYELRDVGQFGFLLPTREIIPNNEEVMDSLVEIHRVSQRLGYYNRAAALGAPIITLVTSLIVVLNWR